MNAASLVISVLALLLSMVAWVDGRRRATEANRAAERSAKASEVSASAAVRSAAAAEEQVEMTRPPAHQLAIEHLKFVRYVVRNVGRERVTGVAIDPSQYELLRDVPIGVNLEPNAAVEFGCLAAAQVSFPTALRVTCDQFPAGVMLRMPSK